MERSEIQKRVIDLGKALIEELDLEPGVDTLSRWMAHYIAELLAKLENVKGDEKAQVQQHCFETILTLWQHRSSYRDGHRPFENFEPIFQTLEALNPENPYPFYRFWQQEEKEDSEFPADDVKHWIDMAMGIDGAARVWIKFAISQAAQKALDRKTSHWLNNSISLMSDDELEVICQLVSKKPEAQEGEDIKKINSDKIKQLEAQLEKLDAFVELSQFIRAEITGQLKILGKADSHQT